VATRVVEFGKARWTVWVNAAEVSPTYPTEPQAIARAEREARTHHHVQVTKATGNTRPRSVATWVDGKRQ
jgi:hypothetical protein